ncbi:MAG: CobW family GTP-binding protein [Polyangiales bacterium]
MPTPVTVVTGFLGAGKTTLLNDWLAQFGRGEVAVVVNEFGAIGIDGELLAQRAREVREITGGCVCCTSYAELVGALDALAAQAPKRIFVETSGAASPAGVVRAIACNSDLRLDGIVTVVDATRMAALAEFDLAVEQVGYADVVVLSHADVASPTTLEAAHSEIERCNATAVTTAVREELHALLARRNTEFSKTTTSTVHDSGIESLALSFEGEVDEERFGDWIEAELSRFAGRLLRLKAIVAVAGVSERMILQGVADRLEVTFGAPWTEPRSTRLVIVGFGLDREALECGFAGTKHLG